MRPGSGDLPDLAFAVALAELPGVGPALLRRLLVLPTAEACHAALCVGRWPAASTSLGGGAPAVPTEGGCGGGSGAGDRLFGGSQAVPSGRFGDPRVMERLTAAAQRQDVPASWERLCARGIAVTRPGDAGYPARLAVDAEAPALVFSRGQLPPDRLAAAAIIGTRSCTHYGEEVAAGMAAQLAEAGVVVVSGLAAGIDSAAHAGALAADAVGAAPPLAIVGGGVDVVYPPANAPLWRAVAARGAILSEAPPGARPEPWRFPQRNRLLAAASDVVVVVESHRRGGSLLTAEAALHRQVPVGAVPGSVRSPSSQGSNDLLADGAHVVRDAGDVLTLLGLVVASAPVGEQPKTAARRAVIEALSAIERVVLQALEDHPLSFDAILGRSGGDLLGIAAALERLVAVGLARTAGPGWERSS